MLGDIAEDISVGIFNAQGRLLRNLAATSHRDGEAVFSWDGQTSHGQKVSASTLFVRVEDSSGSVTRKIVLLR